MKKIVFKQIRKEEQLCTSIAINFKVTITNNSDRQTLEIVQPDDRLFYALSEELKWWSYTHHNKIIILPSFECRIESDILSIWRKPTVEDEVLIYDEGGEPHKVEIPDEIEEPDDPWAQRGKDWAQRSN